jgi:hypothetical protein
LLLLIREGAGRANWDPTTSRSAVSTQSRSARYVNTVESIRIQICGNACFHPLRHSRPAAAFNPMQISQKPSCPARVECSRETGMARKRELDEGEHGLGKGLAVELNSTAGSDAPANRHSLMIACQTLAENVSC